MITKRYIESIVNDLDIGMYFLKIQFYLALAFSYIAKSIYSIFFYKQKKKKDYEKENLFI
jgi:hypothetical protein